MLTHIQRMASYNRHMNDKLLEAASQLPAQALLENRGAFFGSILGTLNHVLVGDLLWLHRFKQHAVTYTALEELSAFPVPVSLNQVLHDNLVDFKTVRQQLDSVILLWTNQITQDDLQRALQYRRVNGDINKRSFCGLLMHFFNHQTHHRGQATTLLSQAGIHVEPTDLLVLIPEES